MRIALFYFFFIGVTGLLLPNFPKYLDALGFSSTQIGWVNSIGPWLLMFVPLLWGFAADKLNRPVLLLKVACVCVALALIPLGSVTTFGGVIGVWLLYSFFATPIIPLADSVAIVEARRIGTDFARLRLWGSIGFIAVMFGFKYFQHGPEYLLRVPLVALCLAVLAAVCAQWLKQHETNLHRPRPSFRDAQRLAHDPALMWFFIAGMVHQASMSPYYLFYPLSLDARGFAPGVAEWSLGAGVVAEIVMFQFVRGLLARRPLFPLIGISMLMTAVRWVLIPAIGNSVTMASLQTTHAFTFALCYAGSISYLEHNVDEPLRATGRAMYSAISQGMGSLLGHRLASFLADYYKPDGAHSDKIAGYTLAFRAAALVEILALAPLLISAHYTRKSARSAGDLFKEAPPPATEEV
ncbi:MAG TPA: MFS transporter [Planctomycetota bacterium]|nr:MFS transporter [Planctomycetota bacterium]